MTTQADEQGITSQKVRWVTCPACGADSVYHESNPSRPFCSPRCKGVDLGAWANEDFRVPAPITPEDLQ